MSDLSRARESAARERYSAWPLWLLVRNLPFVSHRAVAVADLLGRAKDNGYSYLDEFLSEWLAPMGSAQGGADQLTAKERERLTFVEFPKTSAPGLLKAVDQMLDMRGMLKLTDQEVGQLEWIQDSEIDVRSHLPTRENDLINALFDRSRKLWVSENPRPTTRYRSGDAPSRYRSTQR